MSTEWRRICLQKNGQNEAILGGDRRKWPLFEVGDYKKYSDLLLAMDGEKLSVESNQRRGLPPLNAAKWSALTKIYASPWFTRTWVVQEIAVRLIHILSYSSCADLNILQMSKEAQVMIGDAIIDW